MRNGNILENNKLSLSLYIKQSEAADSFSFFFITSANETISITVNDAFFFTTRNSLDIDREEKLLICSFLLCVCCPYCLSFDMHGAYQNRYWSASHLVFWIVLDQWSTSAGPMKIVRRSLHLFSFVFMQRDSSRNVFASFSHLERLDLSSSSTLVSSLYSLLLMSFLSGSIHFVNQFGWSTMYSHY